MPFIGDFGWFYVSARDMLLTGDIPLVGITSSRTWLHQGPFWTYILAFFFKIFQFNPYIPAYFVAVIGVITVYVVYRITKTMISDRVGLLAAALYATSGLVIIHSRMAYHTSLIPLFALFYVYCIWKWVKGNSAYFPLSFSIMAILYNFELATVALLGILVMVFLYGMYKKTDWYIAILNKKIILLSVIAGIIPMIPVLLYDFTHGFAQTVKFPAWTIYTIFSSIINIPLGKSIPIDPFFWTFTMSKLSALLVLWSVPLSLILLLATIIAIGAICFTQYKKKKWHSGFVLLVLWFSVGSLAFLVNKTPSEAYLPMIFPSTIIMVAVLFDKIWKNKVLGYCVMVLVLLIGLNNAFQLITKDYFVGRYSGYGPTFSDRMTVAHNIVTKSQGKPYMMIGKGEGSQFESYLDNYRYLTWWLGNGPSGKAQSKTVMIEDLNGTVILTN